MEEAIANPDDNGSVVNENASAADAFRQKLADFRKDPTPAFLEATQPAFALLRVPDADISRLSNPNSPRKQTNSLSGPRNGKWKTSRKQIRTPSGGHAPDCFEVGEQPNALERPRTPCTGEPTTPEAAAHNARVLANNALPPGSVAVAVATAGRPALSGGPSTVEAMVMPSPQRPALAALARFAAPIAQVFGLASEGRGSCDNHPTEPCACEHSLVP